MYRKVSQVARICVLRKVEYLLKYNTDSIQITFSLVIVPVVIFEDVINS